MIDSEIPKPYIRNPVGQGFSPGHKFYGITDLETRVVEQLKTWHIEWPNVGRCIVALDAKKRKPRDEAFLGLCGAMLVTGGDR